MDVSGEEISRSSNEIGNPSPVILLNDPSDSDPEAPEPTHIYFQHLGSLRCNTFDWREENITTYSYNDKSLNAQGLARINKEIKSMSRSLPCEPSGSIFISIDSSNLSRMKVLIAGTENSPYEHDLFLFDIKLPEDYPNNPPLMTIKTTGNGIARFNPNLYHTGNVCLSIINTWECDPEEMWNPSYSTLFQVFLSIQALVMNQEIVQKELCYEHYEIDSRTNVEYSLIVKYANIKYAMAEMLQNPPIEFVDVVRKHFTLKNEKIVESFDKWLKEVENFEFRAGDPLIKGHNRLIVDHLETYGTYSAFKEVTEECKILLGSLRRNIK